MCNYNCTFSFAFDDSLVASSVRVVLERQLSIGLLYLSIDAQSETSKACPICNYLSGAGVLLNTQQLE